MLNIYIDFYFLSLESLLKAIKLDTCCNKLAFA